MGHDGSDDEGSGTLPDMVPKRHLYEEPLHVQSIEALPPERMEDGALRVTFWVNIRDSAGQAARDLAVEARIVGPERTGEGMANTDEHGQARFRMTGPPGRYRCEILDIAAGAIDVRRDDPPDVASLETEIPPVPD